MVEPSPAHCPPVIWKYALHWPLGGSLFFCEMPKGARPLSVGHAGAAHDPRGAIFIWAIVPDPAAPQVPRNFWVAGTGLDLREDLATAPCLGRVEMADGALIFHVFDLGEV
jgi:hypothetical protein